MAISKVRPLEKITDEKDGFVILEIDRVKNETIYYVRGGDEKLFPKFIFKGFTEIPSGLYINKSGFGFPGRSKLFLKGIYTELPKNKPAELVITKVNKKPFVRIGAAKTVVTFSLADVVLIVKSMRKISAQASSDIQDEVNSFLATKIPDRYKATQKKFGQYVSGELSLMLQKRGILSSINEEDLQTLSGFIPKIFDPNTLQKGRKTKIKEYKLSLVKSSSQISQKIYLEQVIDEFSKNLQNASFSEKKWQDFLLEKVFPFITSYQKIIPKPNIGIDVKLPDFLMIDIYGFTDIFEIKKSSEPVLILDDSHQNWYWRPVIAAAIAQAEKYVETLQNNADAIIRSFRRRYDIDFTVVKPQAYLIVGTRSKLTNKAMREDFKALSKSLKNIEFIFYDDLLDSLINLQKKFS